ncbi:hypothetical protein Slin15195_G031220 [Septoria linicola]|uniref:Uncharacterized protein n=1 Tax=Septoria linicola TaxID=215465 RepID=A0A9Q9EHZ6_9PEZI|nr:hypothetical protein Slin14017_G030240 [Septoria linicola]USW49803.1 hypothetical protein Slin15195_G031220 [Septoria linicola]
MKFLISVLMAISSTTAYLLQCNGGTAGDGGCEKNGLHTYCVGAMVARWFSALKHSLELQITKG